MVEVSFTIPSYDVDKLSRVLSVGCVYNLELKQTADTPDDNLLMFYMLEIICKYRNTSPVYVLTKSRGEIHIAETRMIFMWIVTETFKDWYHKKVAGFVGRERTSVIHARAEIKDKLCGKLSHTAENRKLAIDISNMTALISEDNRIKNLKKLL